MAYENGIRDVLKEIIEKYGIQILYNGRKVNALLKDLAAPYERERKILKSLYDENIHIRMLGCMDYTDAEKKAVLQKGIVDLVSEAWVSEEGARYAVYSLAYALGWDALVQASGSQMQEEARTDAVKAGESAAGSVDGVLRKGKHAIDNLDFHSTLLQYQAIGYKAFAANLRLQEAVIPEGIRMIGKKAFFGCGNLKRIQIPQSVEAVGALAFEACYGLTSIEVAAGSRFYTALHGALIQKENKHLLRYAGGEEPLYQIPEGIQTVAIKAFDRAAVHAVQMPRSVSAVTFRSFYICEELSAFIVDGKNADFCADQGVLHTKDRKTLLIYPGGRKEAWYVVEDFVETIGEGAFLGAENLETVTIPGSVRQIGSKAFAYCVMLSAVVLPSGLLEIGDCAFYHCLRLTHVLFPKGISAIGDRAFEGCASLERISIPPSVERIGFAAFKDCDKLKSITIQEGVTFIGDGAFAGCPWDLEAHVRKGSYAERWFQLRHIKTILL